MNHHMLLPTLPPYILSLGGGEYQVGLIVSAFSLAAVLVRPVSGKWIDTGRQKKLLLGGAVVYMGTSVLYMITRDLRLLWCVRFMHGLGMGAYSTAANCLAADLAPSSRRGEALGYLLLATSLAMAIGPAVGLYVVNRCSYLALFATSAALAAAAYLCLLPIAVPLAERCAGRPVSHGNLGTASSGVPLHRQAVMLMQSYVSLEAVFPAVVLATVSATYGSLASFVALFARSKGITATGSFFTAFAVSMFLTRLVSGRISDRWGREAVLIPGFVAVCSGMAALARMESLLSLLWCGLLDHAAESDCLCPRPHPGAAARHRHRYAHGHVRPGHCGGRHCGRQDSR